MHYQSPRNSQTASNGNNTKKAAKRRKMRKKSNSDSIRQPNPIAQIYQVPTEHNMARVADDATEKRLRAKGPDTSTRLAGYNYIW